MKYAGDGEIIKWYKTVYHHTYLDVFHILVVTQTLCLLMTFEGL